MLKRCKLWLCLCAAAGLLLSAKSLAAAEDPVKAELLADASVVAPGQPFRVGVLLRIAPEWHIYWKYPGDAGLATAVTLELPKGFTAGELQWPLPAQFVQPGDLVTYGYSGSVLLMAQVTPPKNLEAGDIAIRAKVFWLGCRKVCLPGRADLDLKLTAGRKPEPANEALFADWTARLPQPSSAWVKAGQVNGVTVKADTIPPSKDTQIVIAITWPAPPAKVEVFPAPTDALLVDKPAVNTREKRTEALITARRSGVGAADRLECVVVYTLPDRERNGFPVMIEMPKEPAAKSAAP